MSDDFSNSALPDGWVPAPRLTAADLTGTFWSFGPLGTEPYVPFLVLAPEGLIGNYHHHNEDIWQVFDGELWFVSSAGLPTTRYSAARIVDGEVVALAGPVSLPGIDFLHELRRVEHPEYSTAPLPKKIPHFLKRLDKPRRPNLVVLRAGEQSLHSHWMGDSPDAERNWDLCVSYYGKDPWEAPGNPEYLTHQAEERKFQAIYHLFHRDSPLWNYERIWLPDDDLMTNLRDINAMFHVTHKFGLDLAQPSLQRVPECYIAHWVTGQQPDSLLHYSDFIEIMCPVFSNRGLRICVESFRDCVTGYGMDYIWPVLLGAGRYRAAVIDAVGLIHTRPTGRSYDVARAKAEEQALFNAYNYHRIHLPPPVVLSKFPKPAE